MKLKPLTTWLADRLQEKSTWYAIIGFLSALNVRFNPELTQNVIELAVAAASLIAFVTKEKK
jgi:hypothetical protein